MGVTERIIKRASSPIGLGAKTTDILTQHWTISEMWSRPSYTNCPCFRKPLGRFRYSRHGSWKHIAALSAVWLLISRLIKRSYSSLTLVIDFYCSIIILGYLLLGTITLEVYTRGLVRISTGGSIAFGKRGINRNIVLRKIRAYLCHYVLGTVSAIEIIVGDQVDEIERLNTPKHENSPSHVTFRSSMTTQFLEFKINQQRRLPMIVDGMGDGPAMLQRLDTLTFPLPVDGYFTLMYLFIHSIENFNTQWPPIIIDAIHRKSQLIDVDGGTSKNQ